MKGNGLFVESSIDRSENDWYATPEGFTRELLKLETFNDNIWEPAAGDGAMANVLTGAGYNVLATDLFPHYEHIAIEDFLTSNRTGYDIITNPPFKLTIPFAKHAWELCDQKFAFVMPIYGLNSSGRYEEIWSKMGVSKILLAGKNQHILSARGTIKSMFTHIWVVFDKKHKGPPTFHWTPNEIYKHEFS